MKEQLKFALSEAAEANLVKASASVAERGFEDLAKLGEVGLPDGWEWQTLRDVARFKKGKKPALLFETPFENSLPYIDIEAFESGNYRRFAYKDSGVQADDGDVLIVWDGARAGLIGKAPKGLIGSTIAALILNNIDSDYLRLFLQSQYDDINQNTKGSAIPHIDPAFFWTIRIPLPPLDEQRRIVARIKSYAQRIEEIQILRSEAVEAMNSWILAELNTVFEDLAAEYSTQSLDELFTFRNDVLHPSDKPKGIVRFVGLQHVESNTGRKIGEVILQAEQLEGRKFRFSPGEIVYGYLRPYLNKVWIADCEGLCSVDQYVLKPDRSLIETTYLAYAMRSPYFLSQSKELTGVLMLPRLRSGLLKQIEIPVPPLTEQHRIVAKLDRLQAKAESIRTAQAETQKELDALLPAVLDRAFRGEL